MRLASRAWLLPPSRPLLQQLRPWPRSCPSAFGPWPSATVTHSPRSSCWRWPRPAEMGSKHVETKKAHEKCNVTLSARSIIPTPFARPLLHPSTMPRCFGQQQSSLMTVHSLQSWQALKRMRLGFFVDKKEQSISTIELNLKCFGTLSPAR